MKLQVDFFLKKNGEFMTMKAEFEKHFAERLMYRNYKNNEEDYWDAVGEITNFIASKFGIPAWEKTYLERTFTGEINAPVSIITIKKL